MKSSQIGVGLDSIVSSEDADAYTATYDQQSTTPSVAVVGAVADALDADPLELGPLFETVDADALDALLQGGGGGAVEVSFAFAGCDVTMSGDGRIRLSTPDE